jgi:hypothetical protein
MIDIRSTPASIRVHQFQADLQISSKLPRVEVQKEQISIQIDQSQCFEEAGLKGIAAMGDDISNRAKAAVLQGIERVAAEGDMLGAVENKGNPIPVIAYNNLFQEVDYNIELMPRSKPKIDFIGGNLDIRVDEGYTDIQVTPRKPQIDVQLGSIKFSYIQPLQAGMTSPGSKIDSKV